MADILIISPISIAGELIMRGFKTGLEALGHNVLFTDVRELKEAFGFDYVLSYDYGYLANESAFLSVRKILSINPKVKLIHYFADNPTLNYAHSGQCGLKEKFFEFCKLHKNNIELVFWDKKFIEDFCNIKSSYFPICVDCSIYKDFGLEEKYDITFLGRPLGGERQKILSEIIKKFPKKLKIFSYPKHFENSIEGMKHFLNDKEMLSYKNCYCGFVESQEELSKIYNSSKINLNINLQGDNSLNYRTFEVLASKGFLLCDKREDLKSLGLEDVVVQYENEFDLIEKISHYLAFENERNEIKARARKLVSQHYDIVARAGEILNTVE